MRIRFPTVAKRLALLLVVVLAGDRALAWMLARAVSRAGTRFARAYRGGVDADVLVAGDSRGVNGLYGPAIRDATGLSAFNLAYNGLSTHLCEALVLDYLERNRAPRLLLVEASNVRSPDEVDAVLVQAEKAGAQIAGPGGETFWGGYSGVFVDPNGHPWEVTFNPGRPHRDDGSVDLPS